MADLNSMCNLAALRVSAFIAQQGYNATIALVSDRLLHDAAKREMDEVQERLEHAEFEAYLEQQQDEWWAEESARIADEKRAEEADREFRDTHTWQQYVLSCYPGEALARAGRTIKAYVDAGWSVTYGYDCNSNPEGISEEDLYKVEDEARQLMLAALSMLADVEIEAAIQGNKNRDFDGTSFTVTDLGEVQRWRAEHGHLTISGKAVN